MPALYRKEHAIGSKSLPHVCVAWRVSSGNVAGISLPRRIAIYSDKCALFLALHLRAYSLYSPLLFCRQVARYSFVELGGCLLMPSPLFFVLWIMLAVAAWVHICVNVPVFADNAWVFDFKVILHLPTPYFIQKLYIRGTSPVDHSYNFHHSPLSASSFARRYSIGLHCFRSFLRQCGPSFSSFGFSPKPQVSKFQLA